MEGRTTHYKFQKSIYKVKNYKDTCVIPEYDISKKTEDYKKGIWNRKSIDLYINEDKFLEHFADITKGLEMKRTTVVVEEYDNKLSLKIYHNIKKRRVGSRNFYVRKYTYFTTYDFKKKNIYTGQIVKSRKKIISKKLRVNNFMDITYPYNVISDLIIESRMIHYNRVMEQPLHKDISPQHFYDTQISVEMDKIKSSLNNIIKKHTKIKPLESVHNIKDIFYRMYLLDNGFKAPDSFAKFTHRFIPKKELRKDNNLIKTYMRINSLYGSKIRKYLNEDNNINIDYVTLLFRLLGVDYFNMLIPYNLTDELATIYINQEYGRIIKNSLDKRDLKRIVIGLNDGIDLNILLEHFEFRDKLKKYNHEFKIKFNSGEEFTEEHYEISELLQSYRNGKVTRFYGLGVKDMIEEPIISMVGIDFYPVLLETSKNYNEESTVQNNCVRTYSQKPHNIIVSLRMGGDTSKERATVEYQFRKNDIIRIQTRGKYNNDVPETWNTVLEVLDSRLSNLYQNGKLMLPRLTKEYSSGFSVTRNSVFEDIEQGKIVSITPRWDMPLEEDDNSLLFDFF
jgi:hypothetical protein